MTQDVTDSRPARDPRASERDAAEADRLDAALVQARVAVDTGHRAGLDEVIAARGYDRAELEAELEADRTAEGDTVADRDPR